MSDTRLVPISIGTASRLEMATDALRHLGYQDLAIELGELLAAWDEAADVAATHEKIREHAEAIRWDAGHFSDPLTRLERIHGHAEAILALLPSEHTPARDYPANPFDDGVDLYEPSEHTPEETT